ncbi:MULTISPECIES: helix-turn-helix domain-containing protein [Pandoraea]|jgi:CRP/FNR family transcriptional regulator|uniref:Fumarate and nitrate reduction regulatory protein n=1 Tax=Pandoraea pnomenusa TaxID=93220 RepID=A0A378YDT6_9BURK|nr:MULTISPECIES: cyclic nucleotide-binding domain-containing protein [Pandoraea]MBN9094955.1 helix-turn-helix domain-containing protein [Pandoraea pnomenusa]QDH59889.1 cyclic nucleotide-binding domain-containing protein [Pandoraea pnomenusa]QDX21858.1 cyclic nucleotide-binding domain-containing protein [Pandoraea pnomenusa]SUA74690.1 Fumarate and nitrate reduction regulatory protein [Pandoraea pnomenusa]VVE62852.1 Fumarate and nitrate reduction regulatory protein [Pandoraea pnomenusa]
MYAPSSLSNLSPISPISPFAPGPREPAEPAEIAARTIRIHRAFDDVDASAPRCSTCLLRQFCLAEGLSDESARRLDCVTRVRRTVRRGEVLFRPGDTLEYIYAVRAGSFKTVLTHPDGREQVTGYLMGGELLGLAGIAGGRYVSEAVALEDSQVCAIQFAELESIGTQAPAVQHQLHRLIAAGIVREQQQLLRLGTARGEARLASFLLDVSARLAARGYSPNAFLLRMTREEIGSFLGLQLETVSRMLSRMQAQNALRVRQREITLLDIRQLTLMANATQS